MAHFTAEFSDCLFSFFCPATTQSNRKSSICGLQIVAWDQAPIGEKGEKRSAWANLKNEPRGSLGRGKMVEPGDMP